MRNILDIKDRKKFKNLEYGFSINSNNLGSFMKLYFIKYKK
jgi:hypothetical protein